MTLSKGIPDGKCYSLKTAGCILVHVFECEHTSMCICTFLSKTFAHLIPNGWLRSSVKTKGMMSKNLFCSAFPFALPEGKSCSCWWKGEWAGGRTLGGLADTKVNQSDHMTGSHWTSSLQSGQRWWDGWEVHPRVGERCLERWFSGGRVFLIILDGVWLLLPTSTWGNALLLGSQEGK